MAKSKRTVNRTKFKAAAEAGPKLATEAPTPEPSGRTSFTRYLHVMAWVVLGAVIYFNGQPKPKGTIVQEPVTAQQPAPRPQAVQGPKMGLETKTLFRLDGTILDLKVASNGDVYVLDQASLRLFRGGKLAKSLALEYGPNRAMALGPKDIYLTNSDKAAIEVVSKQLEVRAKLTLNRAKRLLGIAWRKELGELAVAEVDGSKLFRMSAKGGSRGIIEVAATRSGAVKFCNDLQADEQGRFALSDQSANEVLLLAEDGMLLRRIPSPCATTRDNRVAFSAGQALIHCPGDDQLHAFDMRGKLLGVSALASPKMITVGEDGLIYAYTKNEVAIVKPLIAPSLSPAPAQ